MVEKRLSFAIVMDVFSWELRYPFLYKPSPFPRWDMLVPCRVVPLKNVGPVELRARKLEVFFGTVTVSKVYNGGGVPPRQSFGLTRLSQFYYILLMNYE